jgi:hypothetical protein
LHARLEIACAVRRLLESQDLEGNDRRDGQIVVNFDPVRLPKGTYTVAAAVRDRVSDQVGVAFNRIRF